MTVSMFCFCPLPKPSQPNRCLSHKQKYPRAALPVWPCACSRPTLQPTPAARCPHLGVRFPAAVSRMCLRNPEQMLVSLMALALATCDLSPQPFRLDFSRRLPAVYLAQHHPSQNNFRIYPELPQHWVCDCTGQHSALPLNALAWPPLSLTLR